MTSLGLPVLVVRRDNVLQINDPETLLDHLRQASPETEDT